MTGCILWAGSVNGKGYGTRRINGHTLLAHRVAYEEAHGEIPAGLQVHHTCHTRRCVNPDHLTLRSALEHNREHMQGEAIGEVALRVLSDGAPHHRSEIVAASGAAAVSVTRSLQRARRRGEVVRLSRGVYQLAGGAT